jgi:hypothetical protein
VHRAPAVSGIRPPGAGRLRLDGDGGGRDRRAGPALRAAGGGALSLGLRHAPGVAGPRHLPRLLQGILALQTPGVECVWIIHAPENTPSGVGMAKAGLLPVGQLSFHGAGGVGLAPFDSLERAHAGAALLGIPLVEHVPAPCWHCDGATHTDRTAADAPCCWPPLQPTAQPCTCAIPLKPSRTPGA